MAVAQESIDLLDQVRITESKKFASLTSGSMYKMQEIRKVFDDISLYIQTRSSTILTIENEEKTLSINIINFDEINKNRDTSYYTKYVVTISKSCLTYKVDEIQDDFRTIRINRKQFDKNKI